MIAERLIHEAATQPIDEHAVLRMEEGHRGQSNLGVRGHSGRHQVAVEARTGSSDRRPHRPPEHEAATVAVRIGPQREVPRGLSDPLGAELGAPGEPPRGEHGVAREHGSPGSIAADHRGPDHSVLLVLEQAVGLGLDEQFAPRVVAHDPLHRRDQQPEVDLVANAEAEQLDLGTDRDPERDDPVQSHPLARDQMRAESGIPERIDLAQDLERGGRPDELGLDGRSADTVRLLDHRDPRALLDAAGRGGQA